MGPTDRQILQSWTFVDATVATRSHVSKRQTETQRENVISKRVPRDSENLVNISAWYIKSMKFVIILLKSLKS